MNTNLINRFSTVDDDRIINEDDNLIKLFDPIDCDYDDSGNVGNIGGGMLKRFRMMVMITIIKDCSIVMDKNMMTVVCINDLK